MQTNSLPKRKTLTSLQSNTYRRGVVSVATAMVALILLCISATFSPAQEMTRATLLKEYVEVVEPKHEPVGLALREFKLAKFDLAKTLLQSAVDADPQLPPADVLMARMFFAANQLGPGRTALERVVNEFPNDPSPHLVFAELAVDQGRIAEADLAVRKVSEQAKTLENEYRKTKIENRASRVLARIYESREEWQKAADMLKASIDAAPNKEKLVGRLARNLYKSGDEKAAMDYLTSEWDNDKEKFRRPEISMAMLHEEAGEPIKAAAMMNIGADAAPDDLATQAAIAQWALEHGEFELATECSGRALRVSENSINSRMLAALVARYKGEYDEAYRQLESVHLESPANLGALIELGLVCANIEGREQRSIEYAQVAYKIQPDLKKPSGRNAGAALAWLLHQFGGQAEAENIIKQVLQAGTISIESRAYAGRILAAGKNHTAAQTLLRDALATGKIFPGHEDAKSVLEKLEALNK